MRLLSLLRTTLLATALLLAGAVPTLAADTPGAYSFRAYGPEQGLRNQAVTGLAQDQDGFIFAATEDGLYRYDGSRFQRFSTADGLVTDGIVSLYCEPSGRLWLLNAKGASAWSGSAPAPGVPSSILPDRHIESIAASADGYLLVASEDGVYEGKPNALVLSKQLRGTEASAVWIARDGKEALASSRGKLYRRSGTGAWIARDLPPSFKNELINSLVKDERGRIWIRGRRVLLRLDAFDGDETDLSAQLPGASVNRGQLVADGHGGVWTPTNLGLVHLTDAGPRLLAEAQGVPSQWVASMLIDSEGNLWIAAEGVYRLQGRQAWTAHTRRQKMPSDTVWGVARSSDGVLFVGTNRGLAYSTAEQWHAVPGTEDRSLYAFAQDQAGNFWAAGNNPRGIGNALLLREAGSTTFRPIPMRDIEGPSAVSAMAFGADGGLYLGTQAHGLRRAMPEGKDYVTSAVALPGGIPKEQINLVYREASGRLWVTGMAGLATFDGTSWRRFTKADGLLETHVEAIAVDKAGEVWVSYWNLHGISRFKFSDKGLGTVTHIDTPAALVSDNIYSLNFDAHGALWLGTAQGAKRWKDGRLDQFARGEGLPGDDSSANAFWADKNGDVWFGMSSGLAHFEAAAEPPPAPPPHARVLRVQDGSGAQLSTPVPQVEWNRRALTFHFAALSFINEARVRIQVRLAGFEDGWRDTEIHEARYTGLPPGNFRFEVRASLGSDVWGPVSVREVVILAPWWRTGWAMAGALLLAAALVLLFIRWQLMRVNQRNSELEALVGARTLALEQANAALQEASMVDPLTGLKNRRFLGLSMPDELARVNRQYSEGHVNGEAPNKSLLVLMVDIDHFKSVNDTYGHAAGDQVLQACSAALRKACRDADFVVRWGGEEFLVVARNSDRSHAQRLAEKLCNAVRDLRIDLGDGVILQKTCSVGFAAFPAVETAPDTHAWEDVVKMADQCLYAAKLSGRNGWVGLVMAAGASDPGPRMDNELGALVAEGRVEILSSLAPGVPLRWQ